MDGHVFGLLETIGHHVDLMSQGNGALPVALAGRRARTMF